MDLNRSDAARGFSPLYGGLAGGSRCKNHFGSRLRSRPGPAAEKNRSKALGGGLLHLHHRDEASRYGAHEAGSHKGALHAVRLMQEVGSHATSITSDMT